MELTQAIDILKRSAAAKQGEVDALNLAVSVLEDKFAPELQVLENAKQAVIEKDAIISEKEAQIATISGEKDTLHARVQELESADIGPSEEISRPADQAPAEEVA